MKAKELLHKFFELDKKDRKMYMLQVATINTLVVGTAKLFFGILYSSIWFYMNAVFYGILTFSKYRSVRDYSKIKKVKDKPLKKRIAYTNYLYNGWLLILLGIAYFIINLIMFKTGNTNNTMGGYMVYLVALLSFSSITTALIGIRKYRRKHDHIVAAACQGNIAKALTSIVLTQVVLLDEFMEKSIKIVKLDGITGMCVGLIIVCLGIRMIIKIVKEDRNILLKPYFQGGINGKIR